jgi:hypothetical protein
VPEGAPSYPFWHYRVLLPIKKGSQWKAHRKG